MNVELVNNELKRAVAQVVHGQLSKTVTAHGGQVTNQIIKDSIDSALNSIKQTKWFKSQFIRGVKVTWTTIEGKINLNFDWDMLFKV